MREEALNILGGVIVAVIGLAGYLVLYRAIAARLEQGGSLIEIDVLVFLAGIGILATTFFLYGVTVIRRGLREIQEAPSRAQLAVRPWLTLKMWRQREIVYRGNVGYGVLILAYLFFGVPAVAILWIAITGPGAVSESMRILGLLLGSVLAFIVGGLTYWRLRQMRYGNSVCRLITLPGVVGGWFKADVECNLPADSDSTVVVRLKNFVPAGKRMVEVWRMEQRPAVPVTPGTRSTIPVRLRIPRDPAQRPMMVGDGFWLAGQSWVLEIEKQVPGIDFLAVFRVPIYDTADAPASEQEQGKGHTATQAAKPAGIANSRSHALGRTVTIAAVAALLAVTVYRTVPRSQWMTSAQYQREFDTQAKKGFYPHQVDGECQSDGEKFRADWKAIPSGAFFFAHHGMTRQDYDRRNQEYGSKGYALGPVKHFKDCSGIDRYQATWLRR
jgi:hypothetical protein